MRQVPYPIALRGLGTEFSDSSQPLEYADELENRFINLDGGVELRPGLKKMESPSDEYVVSGADVSAALGKIDMLSEHVGKDGKADLITSFYASGDVGATSRHFVYKNDEDGIWRNVISNQAVGIIGDIGVNVPGIAIGDKGLPLYTSQNRDKTVVVSEGYAPFLYSNTNGTRSLNKLFSVLERGAIATASDVIITDTQITDWLSSTLVSNNDLVLNVTTGASGIVTSVGASNLDVTRMSSVNSVGDRYEIYDLIENNIIALDGGVVLDNVALAGAGSTPNTIAVSGVNFRDTDIRRQDYILNTTRNIFSTVTTASSNIQVGSVAGQTSNDSIVFLKSAVPLSSYAHTHYGRTYMIDNRNKTRVVASAPDDVQDFTTFQKTIDSSSIDYGAYQSQGEELVTIDSFQRYLVVGGRRNVYVSEGIDPIADTSSDTTDFKPVGLFSQGALTHKSLANIGSEMLFASSDGLRSFNITDILAVDTNNISEVIKTELKAKIDSQDFDPEKLQVIHYPRRNWVMFKTGNVIYNFNYTAVYIAGQLIRGGSWSKFTGRLAECNVFLLRQNGDLLCSYYDENTDKSTIYEFDTGEYTDDGVEYNWKYTGSWMTLTAGDGQGIVRDGRYIKLYFETNGDVNYNITAKGDLGKNQTFGTVLVSGSSEASVIASAAVGSAAVGGAITSGDIKQRLRWRGEQVKISISGSAQGARDIVTKFTLYGNDFGRE